MNVNRIKRMIQAFDCFYNNFYVKLLLIYCAFFTLLALSLAVNYLLDIHAITTSVMPQERCRLCSENRSLSKYNGEDSLAIVNLNTWDYQRFEINPSETGTFRLVTISGDEGSIFSGTLTAVPVSSVVRYH